MPYSPRSAAGILRIALCNLLLPICWGESAEGDNPLAKAWELTAQVDFQEASKAFDRLLSNGEVPQREAKLGVAILLLKSAPSTAAKITRAETILTEIKEASTDDNAGKLAWFYLARIAQMHRSQSSYEEAYPIYLEIAQAHPDHFLGQFATINAARIDLFWNDVEIPPEEHVGHWLEAGANISHPTLLASFYQLLIDELIAEDGPMAMVLELSLKLVDIEASRYDYTVYRRRRAIIAAMSLGEYALAKRILEDYLRETPLNTHQTYMRNLLELIDKELEEARAKGPKQ